MLLQVVAYVIDKHHKQIRMGGDPYASHPVAVARILENKGFGSDILAMGLLHDILEDTNGTREEILAMTNNQVANGVQMLTKVEDQSMEDYLRPMFLPENLDVRLVKLADRLHNLLSATKANASFQARYIQETKLYYLPLAEGTVFEIEINEALERLVEYHFENEQLLKS